MHIQKNIHFIYKKNFYTDKQKELDELFIEYLVPIMDDLDHPELIEKWKKHIDADDYETNKNQDVKIPSMKKKMIVIIKMNTGQQAKRKVSIGYLFFISWSPLQIG